MLESITELYTEDHMSRVSLVRSSAATRLMCDLTAELKMHSSQEPGGLYLHPFWFTGSL